MAWGRDDVIVHREIFHDVPWCAMPVVVVEDTPELLVTYLPERAPFAFPPSADGRPHPWGKKRRWRGNGVLMLRRPGEAVSVWHFWDGPERRFSGWYVNLEEPFRRTSTGYDTADLELDIWIPARGTWRFKDEELLEERVRDGRYTVSQRDAIRALGCRARREARPRRAVVGRRLGRLRARPGVAGALLPAGMGERAGASCALA